MGEVEESIDTGGEKAVGLSEITGDAYGVDPRIVRQEFPDTTPAFWLCSRSSKVDRSAS